MASPTSTTVIKAATTTTIISSGSFHPHVLYRLFFLYIEPVSALVGAYYAAFHPAVYLALLSPITSGTTSTPSLSDASAYQHLEIQSTPVLISLYQLANLYLLFALVERLVLTSTSSLRTWRSLLFCLLVADFGHLATMVPLALEIGKAQGLGPQEGLMRVFGRFWEWNAMEWGSVGFVYAGATMRTSFLLLTSSWWKAAAAARKDGLKEN